MDFIWQVSDGYSACFFIGLIVGIAAASLLWLLHKEVSWRPRMRALSYDLFEQRLWLDGKAEQLKQSDRVLNWHRSELHRLQEKLSRISGIVAEKDQDELDIDFNQGEQDGTQ